MLQNANFPDPAGGGYSAPPPYLTRRGLAAPLPRTQPPLYALWASFLQVSGQTCSTRVRTWTRVRTCPDLSPFLLDLDLDFGSKDSVLDLDLKAVDLDLDSDLQVLPASHFFKSFLCLKTTALYRNNRLPRCRLVTRLN